ncbi:phospholipase A and acyltransferase 3-like [Myxocyprinus asiaticus]|uniref:phospholipase A and acyltransferase 3-like n=1 Tax=Myxocyprinus asiaticus TaxID=70543 RepID=UPI002221A438|nr:phospholipase A and acyltransferase 3-like [Myxocyprinus asiaticus]
MASTTYNAKPEPGDLIEIFRVGYQHWAIYVGDGYVIHLVPPSEHAQAGAYSMMSVLYDKAIVKKEELWSVVGDDKFSINNLLDDKYESRALRDIILEAHSLVGKVLPYSVCTSNCEHFVTELRYGKPQSRQVRNAVTVFAGVAGFLGFFATAVYLLSSKNKQKETQEK